MATGGRISLLVSRDLQVLVSAAKSLPADVRKQNRVHTRRVVEPAFQDEIRERGSTRLEQRTIVQSARVAVNDTNVTLRAGGTGKLSSGTQVSTIKGAAEFGANPNQRIQSTSRRGKSYTRRLGPAFSAPARHGRVFFPSVRAFIPRAAALWIQTTYRTVAETFEKAN